MQISLYIGERKKKDKIVNNELLKYIEGDRSDRIKDLILKGLIFEGRRDIEEKLLDMRYMYTGDFVAVSRDEFSPTHVKSYSNTMISKESVIEEDKPDFSSIKVEKRQIIDDELGSRI